MGLVAAGDDHQAGGLLVEAMDDPRALGVLPAAEHPAEHVHERRPVVPGAAWTTSPAGLSTTASVLVEGDDRAAARLELTRRPLARCRPPGGPSPARPPA